MQLPGQDHSHLAERQAIASRHINAVAKRSLKHGVRCTYQPNSPAGSIFRTEEDYRVLLKGIDPAYCGYAPDTGHIFKGGIDVMRIFQRYRSSIEHVHFKDMTPPLKKKQSLIVLCGKLIRVLHTLGTKQREYNANDILGPVRQEQIQKNAA